MIELMSMIPTARISLQRGNHFRKSITQPALRFPAKYCAGSNDIQCVVIIREIDHPWLNEWRFRERQIVLKPYLRFGERLGDLTRLPVFIVHKAAEGLLQFIITKRLRLAKE